MKISLDKMKDNKLPIYTIGIVLLVCIGYLLIGSDIQEVIRWDLALFTLNIAVLPLVDILFESFSNRAYLFGRVIGLCLSSYIVWLLSSFRILRFSAPVCVVIVFVLALVLYLYLLKKDRIKMLQKYNLDIIIEYEFWFLLLLIFVTWFLGNKIPAGDTERVMDYAFMVSLNKTDYMPPLDLWAANDFINYYYYGQYLITFLTKLSFNDISVGYSLGLNMIPVIGACYIYLIVSYLLSKVRGLSGLFIRIGGIVSAVAAMISGNVHYIVFGRIIPVIVGILGIDSSIPDYWFASSTRYIGYIPDNPADKTITEFPVYSFLIGDLHAHVIDIMVVITIIGIMISYSFRNSRREKIIEEILNLNLIIVAFLISISSMSNYWDYPIYYVFTGLIVVLVNFRIYENKYLALGLSFVQAIIYYLLINLFNLPFRLKFDPMFNGIGVVEQRTMLHQFLILWGLPITCVIVFRIFLFGKNMWKNVFVELSDNLITIISVSAIGLVIIPEIIFVKDIYIEGFPRANTMFKLTYEAFIMFGIAIGYIFVRIITASYKEDISAKQFVRARSVKRLNILLVIIWLFSSMYIFNASRNWIGPYKAWKYEGLNSVNTILRNMGDEKRGVEWIEEHLPGQENILFADGLSYSSDAVIPALTGHPTVAGWFTHEWLWHNSYEYINERVEDTRTIYTTDNINKKKELLDKYNVEYVYVGNSEKNKYGIVNVELFKNIGEIVFYDSSSGAYLIKIV